MGYPKYTGGVLLSLLKRVFGCHPLWTRSLPEIVERFVRKVDSVPYKVIVSVSDTEGMGYLPSTHPLAKSMFVHVLSGS